MNMKRLIAMLLAAMMCVSLAACGGADTASDAASSAEEGGYKLALLMSHQTNAFTTAVSAGAVDKAAELGYSGKGAHKQRMLKMAK